MDVSGVILGSGHSEVLAIVDELRHLITETMRSPAPDNRVSSKPSSEEPSGSGGAYIDFVSKRLIRNDLDPADLQDALPMRLLEELLRVGRPLSPVDWLLLPRFKRKQTGDTVVPGDPDRSFRRDLVRLRKFLKLAGISMRIGKHRGRIHAEFHPDKVRSNVIDARLLAESAYAFLRDSQAVAAYDSARRALALDPDCFSAAVVIAKIRQRRADLLQQDDILRAELCLARRILMSAAAILRLRESAASTFPEIARAHQRAINVMTWSERSWRSLRTLTLSGGNELRKMVEAFVRIALVAGRGEGDVDQRELAASPPMVTLASSLLDGRQIRGGHDRPELIRTIIADVVWLLVIYGALPVAISEDDFIAGVREFVVRRIDWRSILGRTDRHSIAFDDEIFEPEEDDLNLQLSE